LEAENKSPRTIEAYTDAVRLLATYCQAHGHPILASELRREHIQSLSPTNSRPLEADDRPSCPSNRST
jgi:hypothetical protein